MKPRLADVAAERLASARHDEPEMSMAEMQRVLARIARTGKPSDRLRALELLGRHVGMFSDKQAGPLQTDIDHVLDEMLAAGEIVAPTVQFGPGAFSDPHEPKGEEMVGSASVPPSTVVSRSETRTDAEVGSS